MEKNLEKDQERVDSDASTRQKHLVELVFAAMLCRFSDCSAAISAIMESDGKKKDREKAVREFLAQAITNVIGDKVVVNDYIERNHTKQEVSVYLDTHWEKVETQLFYVFVKRFVARMGLSDGYVNDVGFMMELYGHLTYRWIDYRRQRVPADEVWINFLNGTLEIRRDGTLTMREHHAEDFFTYVLPYAYDPGADCPLFDSFLDRVLPDKTVQIVILEFIAYCLIKGMELSKMLALYGIGSNGKSVLLDLITRLLGSCNVSNVQLSALTTNDEKRAMIEHKLLNISHESNGQIDPAVLKQLVSGEPTEVRVLYKGPHTMYDVPRLAVSFNRLPKAEATHGFFRRWILVPFDVIIPEDEQDKDLTDKLTRELSGIFNKVIVALQGLLVRKAFTKSEVCDRALARYQSTSNSVQQFLEERCVVSESGHIKLKELYNYYREFCIEESYDRIGKKNFQEVLRNFGATPSSYANVIYYNIQMKDNDEAAL